MNAAMEPPTRAPPPLTGSRSVKTQLAPSETAWRLSELLGSVSPALEDLDCLVTGLTLDSRLAATGDLFFAGSGTNHDGRAFIADAASRGAVAALVGVVGGAAAVERHASGMTVVQVPDVTRRFGDVADRFFGEPSKALQVIGVTGTDGKTSVAHFAARALDCIRRDARREGGPCGLTGTLGHGIVGQLDDPGLTTPRRDHQSSFARAPCATGIPAKW